MANVTKRLSVASAQARLSEIIRELEADRGPVIIERRGKPVAVIAKYTGQVEASDDWFSRVYGRLAMAEDFDRTMRNVVRSRTKAGTRAVDFEDER